MKIFRTTRKTLQITGYLPSKYLQNAVLNTIYIFLEFATIFAMYISSVAFMLFKMKNISDAWESVYITSAEFTSFGEYFALKWQKANVTRVIADLERKINELPFPEIKISSVAGFYLNNNDRIENYSKQINMFALSGSVHFLFLEKFLSPAWDHLAVRYLPKSWLYPADIPYDTSTPLGFAVTVCQQISTYIVSLSAYLAPVNVYIRCCWFSESCFLDMQTLFIEMDKAIVDEQTKLRLKEKI